MNQIRIDMVSEHASPLAVLGGVDAGGQNVHVAALATALAQRGHVVEVHTRRDDPDLPERLALAPGVTVHHVDAGPPRPVPKDELLPYMGAFADHLGRRWATNPPDLVHAHFWMSGWAAARAVGSSRIPLLLTFHALGAVKRRHQGAKDPSPVERHAIERELLHRCDRVVATCSDEVFELVQLGGPAERLRVVPCGVDPDAFRPDGPVDPTPRRWPHRIACVGRLVERKGIGTAVEALAALPDTELVVVGGPDRAGLDRDPDVARLRAVARRHAVADRVDLRGRVDRDHLPAVLRSVDAVICAPWYEPFGIVPLEAMACGVPVVGTAVGGLVDTVVDGETGRLVPPRDPYRLAAAVRTVLAEPQERRRLGRSGAARVRRRYTWDRVADSTLDVYLDVLDERTRAGRLADRAAASTPAPLREVGS